MCNFLEIAKSTFYHEAKKKPNEVELTLKAKWSLEQITARLRIDSLPVVSFKTNYCWIYMGRLVRGVLHTLNAKESLRNLLRIASLSITESVFLNDKSND